MISLLRRVHCSLPVRFALAGLALSLGCAPSPSAGTDPPPPIPALALFDEDFETVVTVADLFPSNGTGWDGLQILPEYNEIELTTERSRTGRQSLRFGAAPATGSEASKADIYLDGLAVGEGDEVWVEWWMWLEAWELTESMFLWDLEAPETCTDSMACPARGTGTICKSPGRRLFIGGADERLLFSDLGKWCAGDVMRQTPGNEIPFPVGRWVRLRVHLVSSSGPSGRLQVWQDNLRVIDATGITLPREDAVYTRMQFGITQNESPLTANVIFVDDVSVWLENPAW